MIQPRVSMRKALSDSMLLGAAMAGESWFAWKALLISCVDGGAALISSQERDAVCILTGRDPFTIQPGQLELIFICGRRSGKTRALAVLAVFYSCFVDYSKVLSSGERGVAAILSASTAQAAKAFEHISGILHDSRVLEQLITNESSDTIKLSNSIDLMVRPASFRTIRGITAVFIGCDETCFWFSEGSANPDVEVLNAARPSLATTNGKLIIISSPYSRKGATYGLWRDNYGKNNNGIVVAQAASRTLNPTLPQSVVDRAMATDRAVAKAEFLGQWRDDIESFLPRNVVEAVVPPGVYERAPVPGRHYYGFVDLSGGRSDSSVLAIGHTEGRMRLLDLIREIPAPHSPQAAIEEFAGLCERYYLKRVVSDKYSADFAIDAFRAHRITLEQTAPVRSELYIELLPLITSRECSLLDHDGLVSQLSNLERRNSGNRPIIDHPANGHDDIANAVAGCLAGLRRTSGYTLEDLRAACA